MSRLSFSWLLLTYFLLLLSGCGDPKVIGDIRPLNPPDSLIPREKMIRMMVDVHVLEAALVLKRNEGTEQRELASQYYRALFSRYGISRGRYESNLNFYRQDPEEFGKMYDEVIAQLIARRQDLSLKK